MTVRYRPFSTTGRDHRDVRSFRQLDERLFRARLRHAAAREYQRQASFGYDAGGFQKLVSARHDPRDGGRLPQHDIVPLHDGLRWHFDHDRTGAAGAHLPERLGHGGGNVAWREHLPPPLGHRAHHVELVRDFMHGPKVLADLAPRNLAGNE